MQHSFLLSGITDEYGDSIDEQIEASVQLGWSYIELRNVDRRLVDRLEESDIDALLLQIS